MVLADARAVLPGARLAAREDFALGHCAPPELTTFALEPRRGRVLAAKCLPPLAAGVAGCAFAVLAAVPATGVAALIQDVPAEWGAEPLALLGSTVTMVLVVAQGLALSLLLLNAPAAIVVLLSNTAVWSAVGRAGTVGETLAGWLDLNRTSDPLSAGDMSGGDVARLAASILVWIAIPMAVGVVRVRRKEVA
jgi:hypothetical protein